MSKQFLYILRGLPASGKSTWARIQAVEDKNTIIVNRDKIREMLKGDYKLFPFGSKLEELVTVIETKSIKEGLLRYHNVIIDSTGFRFNQKDYDFVLDHCGAKVKIIDFTDVPLEECIERDKKREISVGENVIRRMYDKYLKPKQWIRLNVLNNCFRDKHKKHLGFKHEGSWYAMTHASHGDGILIPSSCLKLLKEDKDTKFLKKLHNTAPNILNPTSSFIDRSLVDNYDEINKV